jgi:hypothetical protein
MRFIAIFHRLSFEEQCNGQTVPSDSDRSPRDSGEIAKGYRQQG